MDLLVNVLAWLAGLLMLLVGAYSIAAILWDDLV